MVVHPAPTAPPRPRHRLACATATTSPSSLTLPFSLLRSGGGFTVARVADQHNGYNFGCGSFNIIHTPGSEPYGGP